MVKPLSPSLPWKCAHWQRLILAKSIHCEVFRCRILFTAVHDELTLTHVSKIRSRSSTYTSDAPSVAWLPIVGWFTHVSVGTAMHITKRQSVFMVAETTFPFICPCNSQTTRFFFAGCYLGKSRAERPSVSEIKVLCTQLKTFSKTYNKAHLTYPTVFRTKYSIKGQHCKLTFILHLPATCTLALA